jgi:hypothetical protein
MYEITDSWKTRPLECVNVLPTTQLQPLPRYFMPYSLFLLAQPKATSEDTASYDICGNSEWGGLTLRHLHSQSATATTVPLLLATRLLVPTAYVRTKYTASTRCFEMRWAERNISCFSRISTLPWVTIHVTVSPTCSWTDMSTSLTVVYSSACPTVMGYYINPFPQTEPTGTYPIFPLSSFWVEYQITRNIAHKQGRTNI